MNSILSIIAIILISSLIEVSIPMPIEFNSIKIAKRNGGFKGEATFYSPGLGACGMTNTENDLIVALNAPQFADGNPNPNANSNCNKKVFIKGPLGDIICTIVDRCPGCVFGDLDLSPAAFAKIADPNDGRVEILWNFVDGGGPPPPPPPPPPSKKPTTPPYPEPTTFTPEPTTTSEPTPESTTSEFTTTTKPETTTTTTTTTSKTSDASNSPVNTGPIFTNPKSESTSTPSVINIHDIATCFIDGIIAPGYNPRHTSFTNLSAPTPATTTA